MVCVSQSKVFTQFGVVYSWFLSFRLEIFNCIDYRPVLQLISTMSINTLQYYSRGTGLQLLRYQYPIGKTQLHPLHSQQLQENYCLNIIISTIGIFCQHNGAHRAMTSRGRNKTSTRRYCATFYYLLVYYCTCPPGISHIAPL